MDDILCRTCKRKEKYKWKTKTIEKAKAEEEAILREKARLKKKLTKGKEVYTTRFDDSKGAKHQDWG